LTWTKKISTSSDSYGLQTRSLIELCLAVSAGRNGLDLLASFKVSSAWRENHWMSS